MKWHHKSKNMLSDHPCAAMEVLCWSMRKLSMWYPSISRLICVTGHVTSTAYMMQEMWPTSNVHVQDRLMKNDVHYRCLLLMCLVLVDYADSFECFVSSYFVAGGMSWNRLCRPAAASHMVPPMQVLHRRPKLHHP